MGWWEQNREGVSFAQNDGPDMTWGDGPADILADALQLITKEFEATWNRQPTCGEIRAGLEFALLKANDNLTYPDGVLGA
jgi:hypothetical protein